MAEDYLNNVAMEWRIYSELQGPGAASTTIYEGLKVE